MKRSLEVLVVTAILLALAAMPAFGLTRVLVTDVSPDGGSASVAAGSNVKATFNIRMDKSTINTKTFYIKRQGSTTIVPAQLSYRGTAKTATLNPNGDLRNGATYTAYIKGGRTGVRGSGGQTLGGTKDATATFANARVSWTFTVATPPETIINSGPEGIVAEDSATFSFSSSKANSSFECSLDGAPFTGCTSPTTVPPQGSLADGEHTFRVRAIDEMGNADASPANYTWTVDTIAPNATIDSGPSGTVSSKSATFTFSSSESNSRFECSLDSSLFGPCPSPAGEPQKANYSDLSEGSHTFSVRAIDAAGNVDLSPSSRTWTVNTTVDTIRPTVDNVSPAHTTTGVAPSTNVTATFSEQMNPSSISGQTFKLFVAGSLVSAQVTYDQNSRTATLDPAQDLQAGATYDVRITEDVHTVSMNQNGVKDLAGNTIDGDKTWHFTVEAPPGVVTAAPKTLNLTPTDVLFCSPRQEYITVTNNTPGNVTFAEVSITGPDAAYFSSGSQSYLANNGPFTVLAGNYFRDQVTFRPGSSPTDLHRSYSATLTYKDGSGATIGNPVSLTANVACLVFP